MANIIIDFQDTFQKTKKIEQLAGSVREVAKKDINDIAVSVPSAWKGDCAERYEKKIYKIQKRVEKRAKSLEKNASGLRASAERLKRVEDYAKTLFSK